MPADLSALSNLVVLRLANNALTSSLPTTFGTTPVLEQLYLQGNQFNGTLPSEWSALTSVRELLLGNNQISGTIPASWSGMVDLENLNLEFNQLVGVVPSSFTSLFAVNPSSKVFEINNNNLNRRVNPNHFANLSPALESWFSTLNSTSSRNGQGDITVPIITGT